MKALSVRQPFASFIASGAKTVEWRSWPTRYRGDLLICSSLAWANGDYQIEADDLYLFPRGYALAVVTLVDCVLFEEKYLERAILDDMLKCPHGWAWIIEGAKEIPPFYVKGKLGLFDVEV